ncbi:MAG TPA: winged helix-turn-helix transcriptional regulator [Actinokineospora sp.]|nr:winged helix-turn-helix transcriptional regulator [Actinokineospora sp.]
MYAAVPPHVEYSLTPIGETLVAPLAALRTWAEEHLDDIAELQAAG